MAVWYILVREGCATRKRGLPNGNCCMEKSTRAGNKGDQNEIAVHEVRLGRANGALQCLSLHRSAVRSIKCTYPI